MRWVCLALAGWATVSSACPQTFDARATVVWIDMEHRVQLKKTAPGATLEGKLARAVYWRDTEVFPRGSEVRMVVDQTLQAMPLEPVLTDSKVAIPQGTLVQGVVAKRIPPRRLYRPASVNLLFTRLILPGGAATPITASPVAAEVDRGTHMTIDSEGRIHAQHPGKARFLLDFGVTGGISKVSDDATQLIIEAISSIATDASTAGVARFAAMGASAIYLLTRHGRDVILPPFTEMDLSLTRSVSLAHPSAAAPAAQ